MHFKLTNRIGVIGEQLALQEYLKHGYRLVARNMYNPTGKRLGEIDIIVEKQGVIVFVEVKASSNSSYSNPAESVHPQKQKKLVRAVEWFLYHSPHYLNYQPRIDVCVVLLSGFDKAQKSVIILPNAVELTG